MGRFIVAQFNASLTFFSTPLLLLDLFSSIVRFEINNFRAVARNAFVPFRMIVNSRERSDCFFFIREGRGKGGEVRGKFRRAYAALRFN